MNLRDFAKNNIIRDKETYIGYWLSCMFTVFVFFIFSVNQFHPELNQGPGAVATIMGSAQVIVVLFAIFFLGLSINSFLARRFTYDGNVEKTTASTNYNRKYDNWIFSYNSRDTSRISIWPYTGLVDGKYN